MNIHFLVDGMHKSRIQLNSLAIAIFLLISLVLICIPSLQASSINKANLEGQHITTNNPVLTAGSFQYFDIILTLKTEKIIIIAFQGDVIPELQNRDPSNYYQWEYDNGVWKDVSGHDSLYIISSKCFKEDLTFSFYIGIDNKASPGRWTIKVIVDDKEVSSTSSFVVLAGFNFFLASIIGLAESSNEIKKFPFYRDFICSDRKRILVESERKIEEQVDVFLNSHDVSKKEEPSGEELLDLSVFDKSSPNDELEKSTISTYPRSKLKNIQNNVGSSLFLNKKMGGNKFLTVILAAILLLVAFVPSISSTNKDGDSPDITVINVQSYPTVGGEWTVMFTTVGRANLTISAVNGTTWSNNDSGGFDLRFLEIGCGNETLDYSWVDGSVVVANYSCNGVGFEISRVLTNGKHTLMFQFGDDVAFAYNDASNWWNSSWNYRKLITINSSLVDADLTNFPILINITDSDLASKAQDSGNDITFVLYSDNTTKLNHEIELFNGTTGELVAWVNVTSLSSSADTKIWMYYGNSTCSSQQNIAGTWDSNFEGVQHFNESSGTLYDSTSNNKDVTAGGVPTYAANAKVGKGIKYTSEGAANIIYTSSQFDTVGNNWTVEFWANYSQIADYQTIIWHQATSSGSWRELITVDSSSNIRVWWNGGPGGTDTTVNMVWDTWHYWTFIYNDSTQKLFIYLDGVVQNPSGFNGDLGNAANVAKWAHFNRWDASGQGGIGILDEWRFSTSLRSPDWIKTSYNTMNFPSTFLNVGNEEQPPPTVSSPVPSDGITNVDIPPSGFNITISDPNGNNMNITWRTNESGSWVTFNTTDGGGSGVGDGTYNAMNTSWVTNHSTKYWWSVNVSDGTDWTNETYNFTTSYPPSISNPNPGNGSISAVTPVCRITVSDLDGGTVTVRFYENSSDPAVWVLQQTNSNVDVTTPAVVVWDNYSNATGYDIKYWWKVNVTDDKDVSKEEIYNFTTSTDNPPVLSNENPTDLSTGILTSLTKINVTISDADGDLMNWSIETSPDVGSDSGNNVGNGSISCSISGLAAGTTYTWYANVTDGIIWTNETYSFITSYPSTISLVNPSPNGTTGVSVQPVCRIWANDTDGDTLNVTWATNASGLWVNKYTNVSVAANNTISYQFTEFDNYSKMYYWKVYVNDSSSNVSEWYYFTTEEIFTSVDPIHPYEVATPSLVINATGPSGLDNVTLWYRYSTDNSSWEGSSGWWNSSYSHYRTIIIDHDMIDADLSNFPILVIVNSSVGAKCDDGDSIRFVGTDNSTEYYYEIEEWNSSGDSYVWVNITSVSSTEDTVILMYYNNSDASDNQNPSDVWDNNYEMVLHLEETSGDYIDSSGNENATLEGTPIRGSSGTIAKAVEFENVADELVTRSNLDTSGFWTIEFWSDLANTGTYQTLWYQGVDASNSWRELITIDGAGNIMTWWNGGGSGVDTQANMDYGEWHHWVFIHDGDLKIYKDDQWQTTTVGNYDTTVGQDVMEFGGRDGSNQDLDGIVDEYRFSTTNRNASWINASFHNQNDTSSFLTIGRENNLSGWREWNNTNNPDNSSPWSWNFSFPNGTGYYGFYSIGKKAGSINETPLGSADAICYRAPTAPVINNYDLLNSTGSKLNNATGLIDVNREYYFSINIADADGWDDISFIDIKTWYDNGSEATIYNQSDILGGNLNMFLQYENTTGNAVYRILWPDIESQIDLGNCTETIINETTRIINISFKPGSQIRWANSNWSWDTTQNATNDAWSWNFNITVIDADNSKDFVTDEYGIYKYTSLLLNSDWVDVIAAPGSNDDSSIVTVTYSSNYDFNMSIYFEENLTNISWGEFIEIANNVWIKANADPDDDITSDIVFVGIGEPNAVDIFNDSGIFQVDGVSQTVDVQFNVGIPFGKVGGKYTARVATKISHD